jgi:hypothetical protein
MDRLRGAIHDVSLRLGRNDPAPAAVENVSRQDPVSTARQQPTQALLTSRPPVSQAEPFSGVRQSLGGDDHVYLPSIRLHRYKNNAGGNKASATAVHDYGATPRETDLSGDGEKGNLWTKISRSLGLGHAGQGSLQPGSDYDAEMIDALDAVGTCPIDMASLSTFLCSQTSSRSRGSNLDISDQCSKLTFCSQPRQICEQATDILTHQPIARRRTEVEAGREGQAGSGTTTENSTACSSIPSPNWGHNHVPAQ